MYSITKQKKHLENKLRFASGQQRSLFIELPKKFQYWKKNELKVVFVCPLLIWIVDRAPPPLSPRCLFSAPCYFLLIFSLIQIKKKLFRRVVDFENNQNPLDLFSLFPSLFFLFPFCFLVGRNANIIMWTLTQKHTQNNTRATEIAASCLPFSLRILFFASSLRSSACVLSCSFFQLI